MNGCHLRYIALGMIRVSKGDLTGEALINARKYLSKSLKNAIDECDEEPMFMKKLVQNLTMKNIN